MIVVLGGLPATGKTTVAKEVVRRAGAVYLRIDTIEQAIRSAGVLAADVGAAGYGVAYELAASNLELGRIVVADGVNPLPVTRAAWRDVAARAGLGWLRSRWCAPIRSSTADAPKRGRATSLD